MYVQLFNKSVQSVQFSRSVMSDSLWPHESQHARPPCPPPTPGVYSNSWPSSRWCHPVISSSVVPFSSCPQSLPASGSFPMRLHLNKIVIKMYLTHSQGFKSAFNFCSAFLGLIIPCWCRYQLWTLLHVILRESAVYIFYMLNVHRLLFSIKTHRYVI